MPVNSESEGKGRSKTILRNYFDTSLEVCGSLFQSSVKYIKSGRRVGLTTLPPSMSRMSENVGASTSRNPKGLHGLYGDNF
jgi:hypothetical protein